nr:scoloptoxin SSD976-like isoform X1 [Dermacentor andersoni]
MCSVSADSAVHICRISPHIHRSPVRMLSDVSKLQVAFAVVAAFVTGNHLWGADDEQAVASPPVIPNCRIISTGLSADEKAEVLRAHNELRSTVARGLLEGLKPAANMLALRWDDDLAELAEAQAKQCSVSQELEEEEKALRPASVGQNVGWEASSEPFSNHLDLPHLKAWKAEHTDVGDDVISSYHNTERGVGQFTQMIWANTLYVGCGVATYTRSDNVGGFPYQRSVVCNYGPRGNVLGLPVYKEGYTCSLCSAGTTCDQTTGLCVMDESKFQAQGHQDWKLDESEVNWRGIGLAIVIVLWFCL